MLSSSIIRANQFRFRPIVIALAFLVTGSSRGLASTAPISLALASGTAPVAGTVSLNLSLSSAATQPAGLQWSFVYSPSDFTAISVVA